MVLGIAQPYQLKRLHYAIFLKTWISIIQKPHVILWTSP